MTTVQQKQSTSTIATDPLRVFKFQVTFYPPATGGLGAQLGGSSATAGGGIVYGFMTVSGPATNIEVIPYREGGMNTTALPVRTPVLTVNGWKPLEELEIGDRVIDPYGEDSKVLDKLPAMEKDTYTLTLADGTEQDACYGHLWTVEVWDANNRMCGGKTVTISTEQLKQLVDHPNKLVYVPRIQPVRFDGHTELPIDPYLLGLLLAEGSLEKESTTFAQDIRNEDVLARVREALPDGHRLVTHHVKGNAWKHRISVGTSGPGARNVFVGRNKVHEAIRQLGLRGKHAWEKFIPDMYKFASMEDRTDLLRGIMDGDGSVQARGNSVNVRYASSSLQLAQDVRELVMSLGGRCNVKTKMDQTYVYKGERRKCRDTHWISGMPELDVNPFWMQAKAVKWRPGLKNVRDLRRVTSVEQAGSQLVRCLEVSAESHLFVTKDVKRTSGYIPGHNTQKMPGQADFGAITMSHGLKMQASQMDILWMSQLFTVIQGSGTQAPGSEFRMIADIYVLDHPVTTAAAPVKAAFRLYNCWPSSLAFSDFDAGANAFVIAQMSLAFEGFDVMVASSSGTAEVSFAGG